MKQQFAQNRHTIYFFNPHIKCNQVRWIGSWKQNGISHTFLKVFILTSLNKNKQGNVRRQILGILEFTIKYSVLESIYYSNVIHSPNFYLQDHHHHHQTGRVSQKVRTHQRRRRFRTAIILISMQIFGPCSCVRSLSITLNQILNGASQVIILFPIVFCFCSPARAGPSGSKKPAQGVKTSKTKRLREPWFQWYAASCRGFKN